MSLSVLILTHNEEENIRECIESASFADEIVVVDDESSDKTVEIAASLGAKIYHRRLAGDFGAQKTFAIQQATSDWVFVLDADERFTPGAIKEIQKVIQSTPNVCYEIRRENCFMSGKATHGALRPDWVVRLMPRDGSVFEGKVHERQVSQFPIRQLEGYLIHYPYKDWHTYFVKFNKYTTLAANGYYQSGKRCCFVRDIVFRPVLAFVKTYVINLGFLDGRLGFVFSVTHSFYTMVKYLKLFNLEKTNGRI